MDLTKLSYPGVAVLGNRLSLKGKLSPPIASLLDARLFIIGVETQWIEELDFSERNGHTLSHFILPTLSPWFQSRKVKWKKNANGTYRVEAASTFPDMYNAQGNVQLRCATYATDQAHIPEALRQAFRTIETHEIDEHIEYNGERVFDPHRKEII
ncbi:MAG: hypothetical protein KGI54_13245 [Pseudomonadota bacterium]|nr:hypothetical protein [Pseudomonadota bacterium]